MHPRTSSRTPAPSLAVDWTDVETFSRPAAPRHQRLRRPRSLLGAPLRRRPRPGQRAVLRLLPLGRHHDARGARPARPRAGPADDRVLLPPRPGPRPGPGADGDARRTASRSATSWPTPATPTATPGPGPSRSAPPARSWSRTCTRSTAAPAAPTTAPSSPTATCTARPPPGRCWNSARWPATPPPEQAAAHDQQSAELARHKLGKITSRRRRRLPPGHVPRGHGQDPLPAPPGLHDAGPRPAGDPHPARSTRRPAAPSRPSPSPRTWPPRPARSTTTPPAAHRRSYARRTGAERTFSTAKDPASNNIARGWTRLMGLTPLMLWLTCLLAVRNQRILDRLERPPGRQRPPRRRRPAPEDPPPAPQDPRRPGHQQAYRHNTAGEPAPAPASPQLRHPRASDPALKQPGTGTQARRNRQNPPTDGQPRQNVRPKREHRRRSNVKTLWSPVTESNRRPSPYHAFRFRLTPSHQV